MSQSLAPACRPSAACQTAKVRPDFLMIGAAKCGTTTLHQYLARHPQLFLPAEKEPEFFADKFDRGWDWYANLFAAARPGQRRGEASTIYTWWQHYPTCAARIGQSAPHARLIYLLRHPVDRLHSQYAEQLKTARARGRHRPSLATFETFLGEHEHLVRASEYIRYIDEYRRHFPAEALLVLLLEDLHRDPAATLRRACTHIGVDPEVDLTAAGPVTANESRAYLQWQTRLSATRWIRRIPGLETIAGRLLPTHCREAAYQLLERTRGARRSHEQLTPPPIRPATRSQLLERFRPANEQLADYLGRDLSHWNQ